ncbi:MAG: glycosyltransferase [Candidatus Diapherotrites archaeon]|nr:glycosyltransferase [Candidatus Diapherotrites archaeon]
MISVVIPTLNEEKFIEKTIRALLDQTLPKREYEIIVSDSSSKDATVEIAESLADRVVVCKCVSAGYGRNFGAKHAKGSMLAFIDADTIASPTYLEGVKEALSKYIAATGPVRALNEKSLILRAFYRMWSLQSRISAMIRFPLFPGFNFAVRKHHFELAGGFNEGNITCEDLDLSLRLRKYGRLGFNNKMLVYTSTRRLHKTSLISYIWNGVRFVLFRKAQSWDEFRMDF